MFKKLYFLIFSLLCITTNLHSQHMSPPKLSFTYDWRGKTIDVLGYYFLTNKVGFKKIETKHIKQAKKEMATCKSTWQHDGPLFFNEVFTYFNRGFNAQNKTAILFFGATAGYAGNNALLLGLSFLLDNQILNSAITNEDYFTWLLFHELLHTWLDDNLKTEQTPLLQKYQNETTETLEHIHLMAIQKMVYLKLNHLNMVEFCDQCYRKNSGGYRRSWEIINDIEGYQAVLDDLTNHFAQQEKQPTPSTNLWENIKDSVYVIKDMIDKTLSIL